VNKKTLPTAVSTALKIVVPLGVAGIGIWLLSFSSFYAQLYSLMGLYLFTPVGKFVIPVGVAGGLPPWLIAGVIVWMDVVCGAFLAWNYDLVLHIPGLGALLRKAERTGRRAIQQYRWLLPLEFVGVAIFVMVPFYGTGAFAGSIIGRFIGMKPARTLSAICVGAAVGCFSITYASDLIVSISSSWLIVAIGIAVAAVVIASVVGLKTRRGEKETP